MVGVLVGESGGRRFDGERVGFGVGLAPDAKAERELRGILMWEVRASDWGVAMFR